MTHAHFRDLPQFLRPGDLLVLNTSATLPAALTAIRDNGDAIALHLSTPLPGGLAVVEPRTADRLKPVLTGETLALPGGGRATLLAPYRDSKRLWIAQLDIDLPIVAYLAARDVPSPTRTSSDRFPLDAYQTVFARQPGSAEMPSAGRAFTREMLACLRRGGVRLAKLVLHAGVASLEAHEPPYEEWFEVPLRTARAVRRAKARGGA